MHSSLLLWLNLVPTNHWPGQISYKISGAIVKLTQRDSGSTIGDSTPQQVIGTTWPARVWQGLVEKHCQERSVLKYHRLVSELRKAVELMQELVFPGEVNAVVGVRVDTVSHWASREISSRRMKYSCNLSCGPATYYTKLYNAIGVRFTMWWLILPL